MLQRVLNPIRSTVSKQLEMGEGDCLVAFTDGVTDAYSIDGGSFSDERVVSVLAQGKELDTRLDFLSSALYEHIEGAEQYDDITWIGLMRTNG